MEMFKVIIMAGLALAIVLSAAPTANAQSTIKACVGNDGSPRIVPSSTTSCKKNETFLSFLSGAPQPRFVDNGDGTITDNETGLMWEKKILDEGACPRFDNILIPRSPHCVQDTWQWTNSGTAPDGGVFAVFLARLNAAVSRSGDGVNIRDVCFAGHCDWRIPNIVELQTIVLSPCSNPICIDPIFGPVTGPSGSGGGAGA